MSASQGTPIAVIGLGCRFPGGVDGPRGLWQLAADGRDTAGPVPADRWDAAALAALHDPQLEARASVGCFLQGDVWAWEPAAFAVAPLEQRWVDPQFRVLMEVAWQAVEHAGVPIDRIRGSRTGVYVGTYAPDNLLREARPVEDAPNSAYLFGNFTAGAAGRVAFSMDLRGPVMVISTHCSSGLVALDTACGALTLGECDTALAGAVLLMLSPETHYYEAPLLLSGSGACHAFDARADGYVRGEGAGVLVLKRLADARRDGDRILAVIRGSAVNNDGQASRLTAPSTDMQQQLFRTAVANAGIDPGEVGLVEAHGPGTAVGDPVEYTSIDAVYGHGRGRCALGSIKTNIGHSEPVSGIAGIIKVVECLRRGSIPPNAGFREWNPSIPRTEDSRLFVPTYVTDWPVAGEARLAAVCSYGVTGTNAHTVLESAHMSHPPRPANRRQADRGEPSLYLLSGHSPETLARMACRLADWSEGVGRSVPPLDVAHTLAQRRSHAEHRAGIVARGLGQLAARARAFVAQEPGQGVVWGTPVLPPDRPGPVFVFTGQGSQRPGMCRGLLRSEPVFTAAIDELEPLIRDEAGFSLREVLLHPERLSGLDRIQPALFAVQVALTAVWRSWGVEPAAVIGQSLGEIAAMVAAGGLNVADGVRVICRRSALLATLSGGSMASVLLGADQAQAAIDASRADGVALGVLTSPGITVVSGDSAQIVDLMGQWAAQGVAAKMIDVTVASHSPQVDPILDRLHSALNDVPPAQPRIPFYSTVSRDPLAPGALNAAYWVRNQRETVRFHHAVRAALGRGYRLFIECSAHPLAVRPILDTAQQAGAHNTVALGSLQQGTQDQDAFLAALGALHTAGYDGIDFATRYGAGRLADVPVTDWHRTRHGGDDPSYRLIAPSLPGATQHPLLGGHVHDPDHPGRHLWQTPMGPRLLPWLADHRVADVPVLPGTGAVEMMLAAAGSVFGTARISAADVAILRPLLLDGEPLVTTRLVLEGDRALVEITSVRDDETIVHARGTVRPLPPTLPASRLAPAVLSPDGWHDRTVATLHRIFRNKHDVFHGPAFSAIDRIQVHPAQDLAVCAIRIHPSAQVSAWSMTLHPALADQVVQCAVAAWLAHHAPAPGPVVVAGCGEVRVYAPTTHARTAAIRLHEADELGCTASARLATADGTVVAEIHGVRVANVAPPAERFTARLSHLEWVASPAPSHRRRSTGSTWAVITTGDAVWPEDLALELNKHGASCRMADLTTALADSAALSPSTGVILALGTEPLCDQSADTARFTISKAIALVRQLSRLERPARLWVLSRTGEAPLTLASLRGLFRSVAYEHPQMRASVLEFHAQETDYAAVIAELLDEEQPLTETVLLPEGRRIAQVVPGAQSDTSSPAGTAVIRPGAAYIVTGGLGGLGLLTVEWLARSGAGRIVINGRSAPSATARTRLRALQAAGTDIIVVQGDISDLTVVAQTISEAGYDGNVLRGVFHAAGVVEDATIATLDDQILDRVWCGKAAGAWALHLATEHRDLDHFVIYSSVASLVGSAGQAAYCAANAFADGLVAKRLAQGLPATAIHWGAWSEVGRGQHLADRGFLTISPTDGIEALERILTAGYRQIAYSPLDIDRWTAPYPTVRSSRLLLRLVQGDEQEDRASALRDELLAAAGSLERRAILESFIIAAVRDLLGGTSRHIGPHTSMVVLGLDSLLAIQLQQRLERALHADMKSGVIWVKPTAAALTGWLLDHLGLGDRDCEPAS